MNSPKTPRCKPAGTTRGHDSASIKSSRRNSVACRRCHSLKTKCSGGNPCRACARTGKGDICHYPFRDRKVVVPEHYLKELEECFRRSKGEAEHGLAGHGDVDDQSRSRQSTAATLPVETIEVNMPHGRPSRAGTGRHVPPDKFPSGPSAHRPSESVGTADVDVVNPLFDDMSTCSPTVESTSGEDEGTVAESDLPPFVGESACGAFVDRLMQIVNKREVVPSRPGVCVQNKILYRQSCTQYPLPDRIHAQLMLRVTTRFIQGYHMCTAATLLAELDSIYHGDAWPSPAWLSHLFGLLALGELYANHNRLRDDEDVPGERYYLQAVSLLQDAYESPTPLQAQTMLVLAHYSNALGRVRNSYHYIGIAMRYALSLGMHRSAASMHLPPLEREDRIRIWWSIYTLDRMTCSKLGQPVSVRDDAIDVEMPSMDGLTEQERENFNDPGDMCALIGLARITGDIMNEIYSLPSRKAKGTLIQAVHSILNSLLLWGKSLPKRLEFNWDMPPRHVASLHLAYNECILQTTRPVLLHLFRTQFQLGDLVPARVSPMTLALAESCVSAAYTCNRILSKLYVDGMLATFGYWDAHYIFSSTLVLIISAVMNPRPAMSDAVKTAFSILRAIRDNGNVSADEFCDRLTRLQKSVQAMRSSADQDSAPRSVDVAASGGMAPANGQASPTPANPPSVPAKGSGHTPATAVAENPGDPEWAPALLGMTGLLSDEVNVLANPYIDSFLADKTFGTYNVAAHCMELEVADLFDIQC